jgi:ComF family protein
VIEREFDMKAEYSGCQPDSMPRIDRCVKIVLDALFPMRCLVCNALNSGGLCPGCLKQVPRVENPCRQCGVSLPTAVKDIPCGRCQRRPPAFDETIAPFTYAPPLSGVVHQLKYRRRISQARPLARILAEEITARNLELPDLLIPVPLHWTRLMQRGFNQSVELCRHLSTELGIPLMRNTIRRTRNTFPQVNLPLRQRRANVRGSFSVVRMIDAKSVAVVDDVMTSGQTAHEMATQLNKHGISRVHFWAVLRTEFEHDGW